LSLELGEYFMLNCPLLGFGYTSILELAVTDRILVTITFIVNEAVSLPQLFETTCVIV